MTITQEYLKTSLNYDPDTGVFTWLKRPRIHFHSDRGWKIFNARYAGNAAGSINGRGYLGIKLKGKPRAAHRLAFLYMDGDIPLFVDHKDHIRANNAWGNLRPATHAINNRNASMKASNTSGVTGVSWAKRRNKWQAQIRHNGKKINIGYFTEFSEAAKARKAANIKYGYHANHGS